MVKMRYGTQRDADSNIGEVATLLWSNADPEANFSAQDIDLGQSASNYMYIRIVWRDSVGEDVEHIVDYDLENIDDLLSGSGNARLSFEHYATTYRYERSAYFTDDTYTTLHFYDAIRVTTNSANVGSLASQCIPYEIYGVNSRMAEATT